MFGLVGLVSFGGFLLVGFLGRFGRFGSVGLVWQVWFDRFGLVWQVWFVKVGLVNLLWPLPFLEYQILNCRIANFVGLVWYLKIGRLRLVGLVWQVSLGSFGLVGQVWQSCFVKFGLVNLLWPHPFLEDQMLNCRKVKWIVLTHFAFYTIKIQFQMAEMWPKYHSQPQLLWETSRWLGSKIFGLCLLIRQNRLFRSKKSDQKWLRCGQYSNEASHSISETLAGGQLVTLLDCIN